MSNHVWKNVEPTIAKALLSYLQQELRQAKGRRSFFRLDGFDAKTYTSLLYLLKMYSPNKEHISLADVPLEVRTTAKLSKHENFMLEPDKSATWYRNNVADNHALLLIFNQATSDAQSLKDIHPVTESFLASGEQPHLIAASFEYSLNQTERAELKTFLQRYRKEVMQPQLRNLVAFFLSCDLYLIANVGSSLGKAMGHALPYLGLFRSHRLEKEMARLANVDRLLKQNYQAAEIGGRSLEDNDIQKHHGMLEQASLDDESATGGLSSQAKYALLHDFIHNVIHEPNALYKALCLDWDDVAPVLYRAKARNARQRYQDLAHDIEKTLADGAMDSRLFTDDAQEALKALSKGHEPDNASVDALLDEVENLLPNRMMAKVRKLKDVIKAKQEDFLLGVMQLASALAANAEEAGQLRLRWHANKQQKNKNGGWNTPYQEAINVFHSLYGGIEQHIPSVDWQLEPLWQQVSNKAAGAEVLLEASRKAELVFTLELGDARNQAELTWLYQPEGQHAASYGHIHSSVATSAEAIIPIYDNVPSHLSGAIDLATPLQSLGVWYRQYRDMRAELHAIFAAKVPWWQEFEARLEHLAQQWQDFLQCAQAGGLFYADSAALVAAYQDVLHYSNEHITAEQDINQLYRWLSKMWLIGKADFSSWAVMPLLHPLKLHWYLQRAHAFASYLEAIREGTFSMVSSKRFQQELQSVYSSSATPSVLTLLANEGKPQYFSSVLEQGGYELYRAEAEANLAYGMHSELSADDDLNQASQEAADELAKIIRDYLETYPFSHEGLDIYLLQCRNGALPGKLLQALDSLVQKRDWSPRINLTVHSESHHVPLYEHLQAWLNSHSAYAQNEATSFFPRVTLRLLHCPLEDVSKTLKREDMVILPDVLAEKGATITTKPRQAPTQLSHDGTPRAGQRYRTWPVPYSHEAISRQLALSLPHEGQPLAEFYRSQVVAKHNRAHEGYIDFVAETSLRPWENLLLALHKVFNWVVCYDTVVDRFLLESVVPHAAEVIRYAVGLGPHRQHNLTVSASQHAKMTVAQRLATRLEDILPNSQHAYRQQIAEHLVRGAKDISGDLVLRAAGPGAFLNELIGVVASRACLGQARASTATDLSTWIYLDDFVHWFARGQSHDKARDKYPDLLHVILSLHDTGLQLDIAVLETKCVDEGSFNAERKDAVKQVKQGLARFAELWSPEHDHADKPYWLNQLYQALAVNLSLNRLQVDIWNLFKDALQRGDFSLRLQGHVYIFCHSGDAGLEAGQHVEHENLTTVSGQRLELHSYNRQGLRQVLQDRLEPAPTLGEATPLPSSRQMEALQETYQRLQQAQQEVASPQSATIAFTAQHADKSKQASLENEPMHQAVIAEPPVAARQAQSDTSQGRQSRARQSQARQSRARELQASKLQANASQVNPSQATTSQSGQAHLHSPQQQEQKPAAPDKVKVEKPQQPEDDRAWVKEQAAKLEQALRDYGISLYPIQPELADIGPNVVRYKIHLRAGEQLSKVQKVADDLVHRLALKSTPLIDNVLGTRYVGVDLPSQSRHIIELLPFLHALPKPEAGELAIVIGQAPDGKTIIEDLSAFPHLLVAGSTNSGKSVFLRAVILSLLTQYSPEALKLLIIDPKRTDFSFFNGVKHLLTDSVVTDAEEARDHLLQLVHEEMVQRQNIMQGRSMRIKDFNIRFPEEALPPIVAVIDEYAQLLSIMNRKEQQAFEKDLMSLAAVARSTGIHLILATQRPDAKIVTGPLKANLPARIAFKVASGNDSRIILDQSGAQNLLGRGDLLFREPSSRITRLQAPFLDEVTLQEVLEPFKH